MLEDNAVLSCSKYVIGSMAYTSANVKAHHCVRPPF